MSLFNKKKTKKTHCPKAFDRFTEVDSFHLDEIIIKFVFSITNVSYQSFCESFEAICFIIIKNLKL